MDELVLVPSPLTEALLDAYRKEHQPVPTGVEKIRVSRTVSAAAFIVERIRMAIEFRDESQMRRSAIQRILKRRMVMNDKGEGIAPQILRELIWAKYLQNSTVPQSRAEDVQRVIDKYLALRQAIQAHTKSSEQSYFSSWLLEVAACEIEDILSVTITRDAFVNFMYQQMHTAVKIKDADATTESVQVYLGVSRALIKSDRGLLRYQLLKLLEPDFVYKGSEVVPEIAPRAHKLIRLIDHHIFHPLGSKIYRHMRKQTPPFLVFKDIFDHKDSLKTVISQEKELHQTVWETCGLRYCETGKRLRKLAVRSIIYIFMTKMVFALLVEVPLDRSLYGHVAIVPLAVNIIFPVLLMGFVAISNSPPGETNTERIFRRIREIIVHTPAGADHKTIFVIHETVIRPVLTFIFTILYGITFVAVFGGIVYVLNQFGFTIASQIIFVFFLCVVAFFGYQVNQTANEYRYEDREGLFSPILDFLLLPILRVGQWLSSEVTAGVSGIFTFIFDFFFEIPLKSLFEVLEEWFSFIRRKKEELN